VGAASPGPARGLNPPFSSNETPDCTFHVSHTWLVFKTGIFKVRQRSLSRPVSALEKTQDMAILELPPAAVGERDSKKSSQRILFSESCVKVRDTLKISKFLS
jgi:hypothetical protein